MAKIASDVLTVAKFSPQSFFCLFSFLKLGAILSELSETGLKFFEKGRLISDVLRVKAERSAYARVLKSKKSE